MVSFFVDPGSYFENLKTSFQAAWSFPFQASLPLRLLSPADQLPHVAKYPPMMQGILQGLSSEGNQVSFSGYELHALETKSNIKPNSHLPNRRVFCFGMLKYERLDDEYSSDVHQLHTILNIPPRY
ncbi:hypothetical protein ACHQM5_006713 [Ranunculus cassubicifolius]